jgi:hypothetical protein
MIYIGNLELISFKHAIQSEFEMIDLGIMKYFGGVEVEQSPKGIFFYQKSLQPTSSKYFTWKTRIQQKPPYPWAQN